MMPAGDISWLFSACRGITPILFKNSQKEDLFRPPLDKRAYPELDGLSIAVVNAMHNSLWSTYTVAATIPIAIIMGLYMQIWRKGDVLGASIIGVVLLLLCLLSGPMVAAHPEIFGWLDIDKKSMSILIPVYGFIASVLPVWLLLPRDYLSTFLKVGTILALAIGIIFVMPHFNMPPFTKFVEGGGPIVGGTVIPFIFITIACGALSGFHATIGTGTTPKMIGREHDVLFVGYGAMLLEGFVAIMALIAACVLIPADYFAINSPEQAFNALGMQVQELPRLEQEVQESLMHRPGGSVSLAVGMAHIFSQIPFMQHLMAYWYHFAIMFEAVFILSAVDAGTRVGRFFLQEMLGKISPRWGDKNWWPSVIVTSFIFTGAWGYLVYSGDISNIWPLFGISNQLLASVTLLIGTTVLLRMNKAKYAFMTGIPGIFMTFITFWAGIWLILYQYIPNGKYLLVFLRACLETHLSIMKRFRACLETSALIVTRRHVDKKRLCAAAKTREDCQTVPQRSDGQRMGACTSSPAPCFWRRSEAQNRPA